MASDLGGCDRVAGGPLGAGGRLVLGGLSMSQYDLGYFFDIAVKHPERRKKLQTEDDLLKIDDFD